MYYRLRYKCNKRDMSEEFMGNQDFAVNKSNKLLDQKGISGPIIIERRRSEYFGDYQWFMNMDKTNRKFSPKVQKIDMFADMSCCALSDRFVNKRHPFVQYKLDQEIFDIRRLVWICEVKQCTLPKSPARVQYNHKRNGQIENLKPQMSYDEMAQKAKMYGCLEEFLHE